jgi:hypothetical protein
MNGGDVYASRLGSVLVDTVFPCGDPLVNETLANIHWS